jgi:hypothetical protein
MQRRPLGLFAIGLILLTSSIAPAQDTAPATEPEADAQPATSSVQWDGNRATLGSLQVDAEAKTVMATGWVNQIEGLVEVMACGPKGKVHESVFVLALNPLDLQAALLLINLQQGTPMPPDGDTPPTGDAIDVFVEWQADGETQRARAESFLWNRLENRAVPETHWVFNGSVMVHGEFMALAEESLVVTYWDPYAIVNIPLPCGANDELVVVNTNTVPPYETPITFIFTPHP